MKSLLCTFFLLASTMSWAQSTLTEEQIIRMARQENPRNQQIKAQQKAQEAQKYATQSVFDPKVKASYTYAASDEQPIIQFAPIFNPQKIFNVSLSQKTSLGTTVTASHYSQQITAGNLINNATKVGIEVGLEFDIWKNFLGRLDRAQLESVKMAKEASDLQARIDKNCFEMDLRKIYWSLIANQLSLELSKRLVKNAEQQLGESGRKVKEGLGDQGDVARNRAQLSSRESSVLFFSYQRELLLSQLQEQLPQLKTDQIVIKGELAQSMEKKSLTCIDQIAQQNAINLKYSPFDEVVSLLNKQESQELKMAEASDSVDLKLQGKYRASGVDNSHSAAYDRFQERFLNGYEVGVALEIPFGGDTRRTRESQVAATLNRFDAQKGQLSASLHAGHKKIKRAMQLIIEASKSQQKTVDNLRSSLSKTKRKYKQARVTLSNYILEQDNLFNAELQLIDTKRQVLHLLLDYFKIFSLYPCEVNSLTEAQS